MDYSQLKPVRQSLSGVVWVTLGLLAIYLFKGTNAPFGYITIGICFLVMTIHHVGTLRRYGGTAYSPWIAVALLSFAGDVGSTLWASGFSYDVFLELEQNTIVAGAIDADFVWQSAFALTSLKFYVHVWFFLSPSVWLIARDNFSIGESDIANVAFREHFLYTRFTLLRDSWRAFRGRSVYGRAELDFMLYTNAKYLSVLWGFLWLLVTLNNLLVLWSITFDSQALLIAHRVIIRAVIVVFLSADTFAFVLSHRGLKKRLVQDAPPRGVLESH